VDGDRSATLSMDKQWFDAACRVWTFRCALARRLRRIAVSVACCVSNAAPSGVGALAHAQARMAQWRPAASKTARTPLQRALHGATAAHQHQNNVFCAQTRHLLYRGISRACARGRVFAYTPHSAAWRLVAASAPPRWWVAPGAALPHRTFLCTARQKDRSRRARACNLWRRPGVVDAGDVNGRRHALAWKAAPHVPAPPHRRTLRRTLAAPLRTPLWRTRLLRTPVHLRICAGRVRIIMVLKCVAHRARLFAVLFCMPALLNAASLRCVGRRAS